MKKILILLGIIAALVFAFTTLDGIWLVLFLLILFPLIFFYLPLLFREDKVELTDEAKEENKWRRNKWD